MGLFKVSLGLFFLRLLKHPMQRRLIIVVVTIFSLFTIGYFFFAMFQCGMPIGDRYWTRRVAHECLPYSAGLGLAYAHAALTAGTDLMFIILPISVVRNSQLTTREKWTVATIMSIGTVYVCCQIAFDRSLIFASVDAQLL
jgi:hypothetical protein